MPDPHVMRSDHAPTPFTAEEIRAGCPEGRTVISVTRTSDGANETSVSRFVRCDATGAEIENDGILGRARWSDLQAHASFPADETTITSEFIDTGLGRLDCLRYSVARGDSVDEFWFARNLPGMPVRYRSSVAGVVVSETDVVANEMP